MILEGRGVSPGRAEGRALVLDEPFSFLGGVDPATGELIAPGREGNISQRVLVFPMGRGSTVGSYVMLDLVRNGNAPAAIINRGAEPIVTTGAVMTMIPLLDTIDLSLIEDGDLLRVNADTGTVEMPEVHQVRVVTSVLRNEGRILILQRSEKVGSYRGRWAGVSGYMEEGESPLETALREVSEEVSVHDLDVVSEGTPVQVRNEDTVWKIHPFLLEVPDREIRTDWEHVDHRWILPGEIEEYRTVPGMRRVLRSLGL